MLIGRLISFFEENALNNELKAKAMDAVADIRDSTGQSLHSVVKDRSNKINIYIKSPQIIVPLRRNNDPTSPIWYFHLGDLHIYNTNV
jgi:hypothetical protein